jgi:hypothetical protein
MARIIDMAFSDGVGRELRDGSNEGNQLVL